MGGWSGWVERVGTVNILHWRMGGGVEGGGGDK